MWHGIIIPPLFSLMSQMAQPPGPCLSEAWHILWPGIVVNETTMKVDYQRGKSKKEEIHEAI